VSREYIHLSRDTTDMIKVATILIKILVKKSERAWVSIFFILMTFRDL